MRLIWMLTGAAIGALAAGGYVWSRLDPQGVARVIGMQDIAAPVLPVQVVLPEYLASDLMESFIASYAAPVQALIRTDHPYATAYQLYREAGLSVDPDWSLRPADHQTAELLGALDQAAKAEGWHPVKGYSFRNVSYVMQGYEQSGHVFAVLAFTDNLTENRQGLHIDYFADDPAQERPDFLPLIVFTDLDSETYARQPWLHPDAPLLTREGSVAKLVPRD